MRNVLRSCILLLAAWGLVALAGCTTPISAAQNSLPDYPQIHVQGYWTQAWTRFDVPKPVRVGSGQLMVAVNVRNLTDDDLLLDYQYSFTRGGIQVEEPSGYMNIRIPRKGRSQIQFTSLTANVDDFELNCRFRK